MSSLRVAPILVAAAVMAGCDTAPTTPGRNLRASTTVALDEVADASIGELPGGKQSVTGHYEFVGTTTHNDFKYSFSAIRHKDGSVSGEIEEHTTFEPTGAFVRTMHGTVTCFTIVPGTNMAFLAGIVDKVESVAPGQENLIPGAFFRLVVVDNGEGTDDPPDLGSNARFGDPRSQPPFCNNLVPFNLAPIEHGNITVRQ